MRNLCSALCRKCPEYTEFRQVILVNHDPFVSPVRHRLHVDEIHLTARPIVLGQDRPSNNPLDSSPLAFFQTFDTAICITRLLRLSHLHTLSLVPSSFCRAHHVLLKCVHV